MVVASDLLNMDQLLRTARARTGLTDFGDDWFTEPLGILLASMRDEADLSEQGIIAQSERILNGLKNRLIIRDFVNRRPEVAEMPVQVAAVIAGLPRTGSTMLHRLLSQARGATAMLWWEGFAPVPYPGEKLGEPLLRLAAARESVRALREAVPDIDSIHPLHADEPDEELALLEQSFIGWVPESYMWVPSYSEWLKSADQSHAYQELREALQLLTSQNRVRLSQRWILKAPYHLVSLPTIFETFPDAKIVMTHRDPVETVPSFASMCSMLSAANGRDPNPVRVGQHWQGQLARALTLFMEGRERFGEERFIDVRYEDQIIDPVGVAQRVLGELGFVCQDADIAAIRGWMARFPREGRPAHRYTSADFGLSHEGLRAAFAEYRDRFISQPSGAGI